MTPRVRGVDPLAALRAGVEPILRDRLAWVAELVGGVDETVDDRPAIVLESMRVDATRAVQQAWMWPAHDLASVDHATGIDVAGTS